MSNSIIKLYIGKNIINNVINLRNIFVNTLKFIFIKMFSIIPVNAASLLINSGTIIIVMNNPMNSPKDTLKIRFAFSLDML